MKVLKERRDEALTKAEAIVKFTEDEKRGMSAAEKDDFDAHMKEVKRLEEEIEAEERREASRSALDEAKRYDVPAVVRSKAVGDSKPADDIDVIESEHQKYKTGDALGAIVSARMRFGPWEQQRAVEWARKTYGESSPQVRALQQTSFSAGGAFIPENFVGREFIERLTAKARVRGAGARSLPLVNGSATIPKLVTGATGYWQASEGDTSTKSEQTMGQVKLAEKKYTVLVPISNDLRRNSSLEVERIVADDMVTVAANDEDSAFLKGTGLAGQPKGIYYWVGSSKRSNSAGTTLAQVRQDIRTAKNSLDTDNVPSVRRAWFMHSRSMNYMGWDLVDGNSNFAFPSLQSSNGASLGGDPVYQDQNISITLTSTYSEIYYVEMSECFIGDSMAMELELIENATYDVSGTLRSGVSRDESVIRLIRKTDFAMRHTQSAYVLEQVNYGA
jgi:HK97 family phage major capsid protein